MHICHLIAHLRLGAGRYVTDLAIEQARCAHVVSVCVSDDYEGNWKSDPGFIAELYEAGVDVIKPGDLFHRTVDGLHRAAECLRECSRSWVNGGVAHAHTAMSAVVAGWAGAPAVICTCHGWNLARPQEYDLQDAIAFSSCDRIISPSKYWADLVSRVASRSDIKVQPLGFDLSRYPETANVAGNHSGVERIVCMAELTARKGQSVLIDAMPLVWVQFPDAELCFIGNGDAEQELLAQARKVDPDGRRIRFLGFVENPFLLLGEFDIMCLPALSDNQPVSIIEGMLAGLPVVSTEVGGIPELLAMVQCGECVAPGDFKAIAAGLVRWLRCPSEERRECGENARRLARTIFDIKAHVQRINSFYGEVT
jgi:glycosyltransferase involved in cell wall biosynthesis